MSSLSQFLGGGLKSYQTGFVSTTSFSTGSGEDARYVDVTISSVDTAKAFVLFQGAWDSTTSAAMTRAGGRDATYRLTSATNLRISTNSITGTAALVGRWQVVESK